MPLTHVKISRSRRACFLVLVTTISAALFIAVHIPSSAGNARLRSTTSTSLVGYSPPLSLPSNIAPSPNFNNYCSSTGYDNSSKCITAVTSAIDNARSQEGVGPINLPSDFASLSPNLQIFEVTNLERVDRGLPPAVATTAQLNQVAQQAAGNNTDPSLFGINISWGSNWAAGYSNALEADYSWMYDDGYGSANASCTSPTSSGCWGHRANILATFGNSTAYAGTGYVSGGSFQNSYTYILAGGMVSSSDYVVTAWSGLVGAQSTNSNSLLNPAAGVSDPAASLGSMFTTQLNKPIVGMAATPDGKGYWLVASDGGIFTFGDAGFYGSTGAMVLNKPIVGMAATPDGKGYWLVASDGGIFTFGDAGFYGSAASTFSGVPAVGMAASASGQGYWIAESNGQIMNFGDASPLSETLAQSPITSVTPTSNHGGLWLISANGSSTGLGDAATMSYPSIPGSGVAVAGTPGQAGLWVATSQGAVLG